MMKFFKFILYFVVTAIIVAIIFISTLDVPMGGHPSTIGQLQLSKYFMSCILDLEDEVFESRSELTSSYSYLVQQYMARVKPTGYLRNTSISYNSENLEVIFIDDSPWCSEIIFMTKIRPFIIRKEDGYSMKLSYDELKCFTIFGKYGSDGYNENWEIF